MKSRFLGNKICYLYQLCSELLSKQMHYDFGMRALKQVLTHAGQIRRQHSDIDEEVVMLRAIAESNIPKFLDPDAVIFK